MKKKMIVVMLAYNASETLEKTYQDIPRDSVDEIILVDDCSSDDTAAIARDRKSTRLNSSHYS